MADYTIDIISGQVCIYPSSRSRSWALAAFDSTASSSRSKPAKKNAKRKAASKARKASKKK